MAQEGSVAPKERVNIRFKPATGNVKEEVELPLKLVMLGDFTGRADDRTIEERELVNVNKDNFDDVMSGMTPRATYRVPNTIGGEGEFGVELKFKSIDDFRPEAVVQQVEPLRKLLEARSKLADLRNKLAGNEKLEDILNDVLTNTEKLKQLGVEADEEQA